MNRISVQVVVEVLIKLYSQKLCYHTVGGVSKMKSFDCVVYIVWVRFNNGTCKLTTHTCSIDPIMHVTGRVRQGL